MGQLEDPSVTLAAPEGPGAIEGMLAPGVGDKLLMHLFSDGLTGRLFLEGAPRPRGVIFFVRGEPVHVEPAGGAGQLVGAVGDARGVQPLPTVRATVSLLARAGVPAVRLLEVLRDSSRQMVRDLIGAAAGTFRFNIEEPPDDLPLVAVNPFGQLLDARRRAMAPEQLLRLGEDLATRVPSPRPGFGGVAARIRPFTGGVDLSRVVDGTVPAAAVYAAMGLPPILGGLILSTLAEAGLLRWMAVPSNKPVRDTYTVSSTSGPLTMSEDAMPLAELARLPKQAHELLSLYFELKPERDPKVMFGAEAVGKRGALERGYEARLAQIDPRVIPSGTGRPYLLARAEELRAKLERTYRQISPENTKQGPGAFILLERIGYGGFAEVFRARSTEDDSIVAVKRMRAETRDEAEFVRELFDEARLCRRIRHPNVVRVLTAGKNGDEMYLAMEYVDGGDLHSILKEAHKIHSRPIDALVKIIADASGGLHAAHSARDDHGEPMPILHRDVSPQNILISLTGEPKLTDFGIARAVDRGGSDPKTTPGTVRGKLPYLAPELLIEGGTASVRTDVYAMGMTLYAALARLPYLRKTPIATLQAILKEDLPLPSSFNAEIPPEIDAILLRCCARAPEQRYNSALEFQIELEQFLSRRPPVDVGQWVRTVFKKEPPKVLPGDEQSRTVPVFMAWTDVKLDL